MRTLLLTRADVKELISIPDVFISSEKAYKALSSGNVIQPDIVSITMPMFNGELDIKSGCVASEEVIGIKLASGYPDNEKKYGMPTMYALFCLLDAKTSFPLCIADAGLITYYRTAAAGAYAAVKLARPDSRTMAVLGTGALAQMHVRATKTYFPIDEVHVYGIDTGQTERFMKTLGEEYSDVVFSRYDNVRDAVENADIIATATNSTEILLRAEWVRKGTHINAFGCDMSSKQELDPELFSAGKVVVDSLREAAVRGDTHHALEEGYIRPDDVYAEIGEIALGEKNGRETEEEITIFDSVGLSAQDIAAVEVIYQKALEKGIGREFDFTGE
ncbi:MAG: ornithine cyclodeaminase family protein [Emergencia sp.]